MTQTEIIDMARQAGFEDFDKWSEHYPQETKRWCERMEAFAKLVAEKKRERIFDMLHEMHAKEKGRHNYYLHAVVTLREKGGA